MTVARLTRIAHGFPAAATDRTAGRGRRRPRRRGGSVLILALWTLFFLAALAVAIGAQVSAGLRQAAVLRADLEAYATARAGVATAMAVAVSDTNAWDAAGDAWGPDGMLGESLQLAHGHVTIRHRALVDGVTVTNRGLYDAESAVSLNAAGQPLLASLFRVVGRMQSKSANVAANAVLDWRDADDDELTDGAESAYYASQGGDYTCHNGAFQALEELCLVKGCSRELLDRVRPVVTLYGSGKVNINTASPAVLRCLAHRWQADEDVAESLIELIVGFRENGGIFERARATDMKKALGQYSELTGEEASLLAKMDGSVQIVSTHFRGTVTSQVEGEPAGEAKIDFVFDRERQEKVHWYER